MPKIIYDVGIQGVAQVQLATIVIGNDFQLFGSYFSGKVLVGLKYESHEVDNVPLWKRFAIEIFPAGSNQREGQVIRSIYPALPVVPGSEADPKKSLYSSYRKILDPHPDACLNQFRQNNFATIIKTEENAYEIATINPESFVIVNDSPSDKKFKDWVEGNALNASNKAVYVKRTATFSEGACNLSPASTNYIDDRPSLSIPVEKREKTRVLMCLPFEG